ncbi:ElyC/SanA/YdcF family protein [Luteolibacter sp. LG18]|uniref:SanA/YdcF family protein n=1 Tax=Luteolibacter sp. LG18 TaxID=2819286 RepID=UPI002B27E568|nr:protein SanA [Luteolibacter sp. LG18]
MKGRAPSFWRRFLKRFLKLCGLLVLAALLFLGYANVAPMIASRGRLFDDVASVPHHRVGLVFGCDHRIDGRENLYFRYRMDAAAELWKAGKVDCLIVSGDNRERYYNEPEAMRQALVARGVPADRIVPDYAGLRTLDSVVRAKEVFGATEVLFITQRFQNERAIYLAEANGMSAMGFDARDVAGSGGYKTHFREIGARVKMWLDVRVLSTRPKHLGEKVTLPDFH